MRKERGRRGRVPSRRTTRCPRWHPGRGTRGETSRSFAVRPTCRRSALCRQTRGPARTATPWRAFRVRTTRQHPPVPVLLPSAARSSAFACSIALQCSVRKRWSGPGDRHYLHRQSECPDNQKSRADSSRAAVHPEPSAQGDQRVVSGDTTPHATLRGALYQSFHLTLGTNL